MKQGLVFGGKCTELHARLDHQSCLWRTCQLSLFEDLTPSLQALPRSGMSVNGKLYERVTWVVHTKENDGSVLHTRENSTKEHEHDWITPQAPMHNLKLPTPCVKDFNNIPTTPSIWKRNSIIVKECVKLAGYNQQTILTDGKAFRVNPRFIEEMMGFPIDHTLPTENE